MLIQEYDGASRCSFGHPPGAGSLLVTVPCLIEGLQRTQFALLDTAAEWCTLPGNIAEFLGLDLTPDPAVRPYLTRLGAFFGRLERLSLTLIATEGEEVQVEATFFICRDWPGPIVVGWKGCLERIRFGLDPSSDTWYFASL